MFRTTIGLVKEIKRKKDSDGMFSYSINRKNGSLTQSFADELWLIFPINKHEVYGYARKND